MDINKCYQLIFDDEGYRQYPYLDTRGKVTIGIGNNLSAQGISYQQAIELFPEGVSLENAKEKCLNQINQIFSQLSSNLPWFNDLDDNRQAVLIDMAFNLGLMGLLEFKNMLADLSFKNYSAAGNEILKSLFDEELPNRASRLYKIMITGQWPWD